MLDSVEPNIPAGKDRLTRTVETLTRLGISLSQEPLPSVSRAPLSDDDQTWLNRELLQPLIEAPSPWLNEVCQALLSEDVPDDGMLGLRSALDQVLTMLQHEGQSWGIYALTGRLAFAKGMPIPMVLDGLVEQADDVSRSITGEAGRVRFAVQYATSSTGFPYPDTATLAMALSSIGMLEQDRGMLSTYNARAVSDGEAWALDTPLSATHAMLFVALRLDRLNPNTVDKILHTGDAWPQPFNITYSLGNLPGTVAFLDARLAPVFAAQGALAARDDVVAMASFAMEQQQRLGGRWDGVAAFVYPTHTMDEGEDVSTMDVHHLSQVNVVLWAERLNMFIGAYTSRVVPGPTVMRLLGSFSQELSALGIPTVEFWPAQPMFNETTLGKATYLTPEGLIEV